MTTSSLPLKNHNNIVMHDNPLYELLPSMDSIYEEAFVIKEIDVVDNPPYQALPSRDEALMNHDNCSPKYSLVHEDTLVQENIINTPFTALPLKDEVLKIDVDLSPNFFPSYKNIPEEEDDIINTFLNVTLPSIHGTSPRKEVSMDIYLPSPRFGPTN